jgi:hypothetical protein
MYLDYFDDIIHFKCDSTSTTSTASTTSSTSSEIPPQLLNVKLLLETLPKRGWGCIGGPVHHRCLVLMREILKILQHASMTSTSTTLILEARSEATQGSKHVIQGTWRKLPTLEGIVTRVSICKPKNVRALFSIPFFPIGFLGWSF